MSTEEKNEKKQTRETIDRLIQAPEILTTIQVTNLALELSRNADSTIGINGFERNCDLAFKILTKLKKKIEENANLPTE